jgi:tripartite-type tricarboxylate transporter receptor subunit TctC
MPVSKRFLLESSMTTWVTPWKQIRNSVGSIVSSSFVAVGVSLIAVGSASAQPYPSRLIKIVTPLAASSPISLMARLAAPALSSRLGQPVIVENRPGGSGTIATRLVASAAPDGYTLLFVGVNHVFAPALSKNLDYDPVKDFAPIATVGTGSWILVTAPSVPVRSVKELVHYAKANPGKLNWGFGLATGPHLYGEMFKAVTGIEVARISYKGGVDAVPDLLGGRIDMNIGAIPALLPLIREGKVRALAVSSETRSPDLPDVPTMMESGFPQLTRVFWSGLLAPAGTPAGVVNRLNAEINASLATPEMKASLTKIGFEPKTGSPQDFGALLVDDILTWGVAAKLAGITPE